MKLPTLSSEGKAKEADLGMVSGRGLAALPALRGGRTCLSSPAVTRLVTVAQLILEAESGLAESGLAARLCEALLEPPVHTWAQEPGALVLLAASLWLRRMKAASLWERQRKTLLSVSVFLN